MANSEWSNLLARPYSPFAIRHSLLPRHLGVADAVAVELLVVLHRDRHPQQFSGEFERCVVMRHRAAAIPADIEPRPRDQGMEAELRAQRSRGLAVDQKRIGADPGPRAL